GWQKSLACSDFGPTWPSSVGSRVSGRCRSPFIALRDRLKDHPESRLDAFQAFQNFAKQSLPLLQFSMPFPVVSADPFCCQIGDIRFKSTFQCSQFLFTQFYSQHGTPLSLSGCYAAARRTWLAFQTLRPLRPIISLPWWVMI